MAFDNAKKEFIGNSVAVEAAWYEQYEDRWYFDKKKLRAEAEIIVKKSDFRLQDDKNVELVFEFVVAVAKNLENRDEAGVIMMSCGYCRVGLWDLKTKRSHKLRVTGGNPANNELNINEEDIRKGRKGFVPKFLSLFEGSVQPTLELSTRNVLPAQIVSFCELLPSFGLFRMPLLEPMVLFRQYIGRHMFTYNNAKLDLDQVPTVVNFLNLLDIESVSIQFFDFYVNNVMKACAKDDIEVDFRVFEKSMQIVFQMLSHESFNFNSRYPTREAYGNPREEADRNHLLKIACEDIWKYVQQEKQAVKLKVPIKLSQALKDIAVLSKKKLEQNTRAFDINELIQDDFDFESFDKL